MSNKIMREPIRCLLDTKVKGNQTINQYMLKSGKYITEVVTDLGNGATGVREIYKNSAKPADVEKVVDKIFGKLEIFYPSKAGVIQEIEGVKFSLPNVSIEKLTKVAQ